MIKLPDYERQQAYTLIEVLVALAVFAILATITSSAMYNAYSAQKRVGSQAEQLLTLELMTTLLERDTKQIVNRAVVKEQMQIKPAFSGGPHYMEYTRDGIVNPNSQDKRSTLKRVAYICHEGQLIRRSWPQLDMPQKNIFQDKLLLSQLSECRFSYIDKNKQNLSEWEGASRGLKQQIEPLPIAIQVYLELKTWGEFNRLFIIPEGLYGQ